MADEVGEIVREVNKRKTVEDSNAYNFDRPANEWYDLLCRLSRDSRPNLKRIGNYLAKNAGRSAGPLQLIGELDAHAKVNRYRLKLVENDRDVGFAGFCGVSRGPYNARTEELKSHRVLCEMAGADASSQERARGASAPGPASESPDVTDNREGQLILTLSPHIEQRNGCRFHLDRFDVCLNGELILTSRQPWYDGARELLRRGYPGDTLLTLRDAGSDYDRFVPLQIGYLAQWSVSDSDRGGLKRIRWQPMPEHLKQRRR